MKSGQSHDGFVSKVTSVEDSAEKKEEGDEQLRRNGDGGCLWVMKWVDL